MRYLIHCLIVVLALLLPQPGNAAAQETSVALDARWLPWLGCWQSESERLVSDDARLCVVPADNARPQSVRVLVIVDNAVANEQVMHADGSPVPVSERGCSGDRRVTWSSRGHSRFSRMQLNCQVGPPLRASGLSMMTAGPTWLTIEVTQSYGRDVVEVLKYSRASVPALLTEVLTPDLVAKAAAASEALAARPIDVQDIIETSTTIAPGAVEIALIETNTVLPINRRALIALDDAKVPGTVIDVMVGLAYPDKFAISRPTPASDYEVNLFIEDFWFHSMFGEYPSSPTFFVFYDNEGDSGGGGGGVAPPARNDAAFAVKGKGYVQVGPAIWPTGSGSSGGNGGYSASSSSSGGSGASSNGGSSSSSSSSASASSGGYVGGGGGDTGRTAVGR